MKEKNLQMRRNVCLSSLFLLFMTMMSNNTYAQDQVATLQHNGEISTFYGGNAFIEAYNAADTCDVITLSSGDFNVCDINKPIIIHGAGARQDTTANYRNPTVFNGSITFNCGGSDTEHLIMEGVCFSAGVSYWNLFYAEFSKCCFWDRIYCHFHSAGWVGNVEDGDMSYCKFINCRINNMSFSRSVNVLLINSIVFDTFALNQTPSPDKNLLAYNSYIVYGDENPARSDFFNCVIGGRPERVPQESCSFYNCVLAKNGYEGSLLENAFNSNCMEVDTVSQVFENFTGDFNNEQFILKDEIASSIQGTDGSEVCIYGGMSPYSDRPKYMILRRCTVGSRTTDDGHLSVDIEVVTEQ